MLEPATNLHLSMGEILVLLLVSRILPAYKTLAQVGVQCISALLLNSSLTKVVLVIAHC